MTKEAAMKKTFIHVQKEFCAECSLALTRFMQNMEGIESVEAEEGTVAVTFDETKIGEDRVEQLVRDNIEKLGYHLT
jgi:copper chaperone CopZ